MKLLAVPLVAGVALALAACSAGADNGAGPTDGASSGPHGTLSVALTAAQLPITDTQTTQGGEGIRWVASQLFDSLIAADTSQGDTLAQQVPDLATSWSVDDATQTVWTFKLRSGVKFTDGTDFNADAVVFGLDRLLNSGFPYYSQTMAVAAASNASVIASYAKVDDATVTITTKKPDALFPYEIASIYFGSPTQIQKVGNDGFEQAPVGTGPFMFDHQDGQQALYLKRNPDYWRTPAQVEELVLKPIPDASARLAAIQSGDVNWAEVPPPDAIAGLQAQGYTEWTNYNAMIWEWTFNVSEDGPLGNKLVRQALNYGIDRQSLVTAVLDGTAAAADCGPVWKGHPWYPDNGTCYSYDPDKAKQLLAQAGYPNGFTMTVEYPSSGSGNQLPQPMNELLQSQLAKIGVTVNLQSVEWTKMQADYRAGFPAGVDALNYGWTVGTPKWIYQFWESGQKTPKGLNPGGYSNAAVDKALDQALVTFDKDQQDALIKQAITQVTDDAPWLFVDNDLNSRITAPGVAGIVEPQGSLLDLTKVTVN